MEDPVEDFESMEDNEDLNEPIQEAIDWGNDDLEAAYLKAMTALDRSDFELSDPLPQARTGNADELDFEVAATADDTNVADVRPNISESNTTIEYSLDSASLADSFDQLIVTDQAEASQDGEQIVVEEARQTRTTPRQIVEACLFVGGGPLTTKKIAGVLRGQFDSDSVEHEIGELNRQYAAENRPYEIRFGEGGYRLVLRNEFERIRNKVFGLGPKEVRLSQEALEVLAVVAYHQPIKQTRVEELGKPGCGAVLRQLVRRELLAVERDPEQPRDVNYKTTPRFLSLFGIRNLDELPRHEQVSYK